MSKLEVNQKLWFVGSGNSRKKVGEVTVTWVGRKWATVEGAFYGRIEVESLVADSNGFQSPGRCYQSEQAFLALEGPRRAWQKLRSSMPIPCPPDLTLEAIQKAAKLLGVTITAADLKSDY